MNSFVKQAPHAERALQVTRRLLLLVYALLLSGFGMAAEYDLGNLANTQGFEMTTWGSYVSDAGDINGDGLGDIIIGAHWVNSDTGIAVVVLGSNDAVRPNLNLPTFTTGPTTGFRILAAAPTVLLGYSVSKAGDVNGDGIDDVIVGAWGSDIGAKINAGISYVIFGRLVTAALGNAFTDIQLPTTAMAANIGFLILGAATGDHCGGFVSGAGDVNGDGIDDVIVGADQGDNPYLGGDNNAGVSYIVYGKNLSGSMVSFGDVDLSLFGTSSIHGFRILGPTISEFSGFYVSKAGDVNADGIGDVILGAHRANAGAGIAYVIFGRNAFLSANVINEIALTPTPMEANVGFRIFAAAGGDAFGFPVSDAGDVNNDGIDDIIIGAPLADPPGLPANSNAGIAYIIFGRDIARGATPFGDIFTASLTSGSTLGFRVFGTLASSTGHGVSRAGDVNDDGIDDIIIGAPGGDPSAALGDAGISYVIYGRVSVYGDFSLDDIYLESVTANSELGFRILGASPALLSGGCVSGAGDINGDTVDDVVVGTISGSSYVIYGTPANPTSKPSSQPSGQPSSQPICNPTTQPSCQPLGQPSRLPTDQPSSQPSLQPSNMPSCQPTLQPLGNPSHQPSTQPSSVPSQHPTTQPSHQPTTQPSTKPSSEPSGQPSAQPSGQPSLQPTIQPYGSPTCQPSGQPTTQQSAYPSSRPTIQPSSQPSSQPGSEPSRQPHAQPTSCSTQQPAK